MSNVRAAGILILYLLLVPTRVSDAATYYVSTSGNDSNNGISPSTPWRNLSKVNGTAFLAGDQILFERGGTWSGQLTPCASTQCDGSISAHIVISAYGTGSNKPRIDGGGYSFPATVYLLNQEYWEIRNLEVTNTGFVGNYSGIYVECDRLGSASVRRCNYIYIGDNNVHDVTSQAIGGSPLYNAGIRVSFNIHNHRTQCNQWGCAEIDNSNYWNQVIIENNSVSYVNSTGIVVGESDPGQPDPSCPSGNTPNCQFLKTKSTNITINGNVLSNIGNDGIHVGAVSNATLQYNTLGPWGTTPNTIGAGVWSANSTSVVIQYNTVFGAAVGGDRTAFDIDWGNISTYIQYNYSYNNYGGMLLIWEARNAFPEYNQTYIDDPIVRFNLSVNDGAQTSVVHICPGQSPQWPTGANPLDFENNTIFQSATNYYTATANTTAVFDKCGGGVGLIPYIQGTAYIYNNIIVHLGASYYWPANVGTIFDSNVFYKGAGSSTNEPYDYNKISTDPRFDTYPSLPTSKDHFKLKSSSPALSNGYLSAYLGPFDLWGNAVSSTVQPNRGAYAGPGLP